MVSDGETLPPSLPTTSITTYTKIGGGEIKERFI